MERKEEDHQKKVGRRPIYRKMSDIIPAPIEVTLDVNNNDKSYIDIKRWEGYEDYFVELDRIKDDFEILHWVKHLCGKTWITPKKIRDFIITMQNYNNDLKDSEEVECLS